MFLAAPHQIARSDEEKASTSTKISNGIADLNADQEARRKVLDNRQQ